MKQFTLTAEAKSINKSFTFIAEVKNTKSGNETYTDTYTEYPVKFKSEYNRWFVVLNAKQVKQLLGISVSHKCNLIPISGYEEVKAYERTMIQEIIKAEEAARDAEILQHSKTYVIKPWFAEVDEDDTTCTVTIDDAGNITTQYPIFKMDDGFLAYNTGNWNHSIAANEFDIIERHASLLSGKKIEVEKIDWEEYRAQQEEIAEEAAEATEAAEAAEAAENTEISETQKMRIRRQQLIEKAVRTGEKQFICSVSESYLFDFNNYDIDPESSASIALYAMPDGSIEEILLPPEC